MDNGSRARNLDNTPGSAGGTCAAAPTSTWRSVWTTSVVVSGSPPRSKASISAGRKILAYGPSELRMRRAPFVSSKRARQPSPNDPGYVPGRAASVAWSIDSELKNGVIGPWSSDMPTRRAEEPTCATSSMAGGSTNPRTYTVLSMRACMKAGRSAGSRTATSRSRSSSPEAMGSATRRRYRSGRIDVHWGQLSRKSSSCKCRRKLDRQISAPALECTGVKDPCRCVG